jgi:hypothetical protein
MSNQLTWLIELSHQRYDFLSLTIDIGLNRYKWTSKIVTNKTNGRLEDLLP